MDIPMIRDSPAGRLLPITGTDARSGATYDHFAFVPHPLPETVDLDQASWTAVSLAMESLGSLNQACCQLPNPRLLIAPAMTREALATSELEGTYGALPEILEARLPEFVQQSPETREVRAYEEMARLAFEWVRDRQITISMLCDLQGILARGSRKPPPNPGAVRQHHVVIGPEGCSVYDARFVPPPHGPPLKDGLDAWQAWVNEDHEMPVVLRTALAHYQFESLHPFGDGNGRVGRLVIVLQLLRSGTLAEPAFTISSWLVRRRSEYQGHLLAVSQTGDWNPWVQFFCQAVRDQCDHHVAMATELLAWSTKIRSDINARNWSGLIFDVADDLVNWPVITNRLIRDLHGVSAPAAKSAIDRLVEIGVLREMTGRPYRRIYGAHEVIAIVERL